MSIHLTESDKEDIVRMTSEGVRTTEIAEWIGCSRTTVNKYRERAGIKSIAVRVDVWTSEDDERLVSALEQSVSYADISEMLGRTVASLRNRACLLRHMGKLTTRRPPGRKPKNYAA